MSNEDLKKYMGAVKPKKEQSIFRKFINENADLRVAPDADQQLLDQFMEEFQYVDSFEELHSSYTDLFDEFEYPFADLVEQSDKMQVAMAQIGKRIQRIQRDTEQLDSNGIEDDGGFERKVKNFAQFFEVAEEKLKMVSYILDDLEPVFNKHKPTK